MCDSVLKLCQCTPEFPVTDHEYKCGKRKFRENWKSFCPELDFFVNFIFRVSNLADGGKMVLFNLEKKKKKFTRIFKSGQRTDFLIFQNSQNLRPEIF